MRHPSLSFRPNLGAILLGGLLLSGCAVGPEDSTERNRSFWNLATIFSTEKEKAEVTPVDDPASEEARKEQNNFKNIPLIGGILAAIFNPKNLPKDEELAVDEDDKFETAPKDYRVPVRLTRITEDHLLADRAAPLLKVFHVNNGRLHAFSSPITIRGMAEDANGIASLKINGTLIPMRSRVFTKKLHVPFGEHQTLIEAEDNAGNVAYFQFKLVRKSARQNAARLRPGRGSIDIRPVRQPAPPPRLAAMKEPGVYMVLMAGSRAAHIVKMPNLKKCRAAVEFSTNAACTVHAGRSG